MGGISDARLAVLLLVAWLAFAAALGVSGAFSDIFEIPGVRVGVGLSVALLFSFLVQNLISDVTANLTLEVGCVCMHRF